jgi:hypothetical protein
MTLLPHQSHPPLPPNPHLLFPLHSPPTFKTLIIISPFSSTMTTTFQPQAQLRQVPSMEVVAEPDYTYWGCCQIFFLVS